MLNSTSRTALALSWVLAAAASSAAQAPKLFPVLDVDLKSAPADVLVADLDGDGSPDLAAADEHGVSIALAVAPGVFSEATSYTQVGPSRGIGTARVDGDGLTDLVASTANGLAVLHNQGGGAFGGVVTIGTPFPLKGLQTADLNGDSRIDVVALSANTGQAAVFLGGPSGLSHVSTLALPPFFPIALGVGDFDHSGSLDVVIHSYPTSAGTIFLNDGSGAFSPGPSTADMQCAVVDVTIADLDLDANPDLLALCKTGPSESFSWRLGDGVGGFGPTYAKPIDTPVVGSIAVGSFDGGGGPDVVISTHGVALFSSSDVEFELRDHVANGDHAAEVVVADVDVDGHDDVVVASAGVVSPRLSIVRGKGDGTLEGIRPYGFGPFDSATSGAIGDFDADGYVDAVCAREDGDVDVLYGAANATFEAVAKVPLVDQALEKVAVADFDGDGTPDLAVASNLFAGGVWVVPGTNGGFPPTALAVFPSIFTRSLAIADFDGNGLVDLAAAGFSPGVKLGLNLGAWTFAPEAIPLPGVLPHEVATGDLNGDGRADLVCANGSIDNVSVLLGQPSGVLGAPLHVPAGDAPTAPTVGDLDGDGAQDIAVVNGPVSAPALTVLLGDGAGSSSSTTTVPLPSLATYPLVTVGIGDLDSDGLADLAAAGPLAGIVLVLQEPDGFARPRRLFTGFLQPMDLEIADLDADGRVDLLTANRGGGGVGVLASLLPEPAGVASVGTGTPGCAGALGMTAVGEPTLGSSSFSLFTTNAPPHALGCWLVGDSELPLGGDPFGLGVVLHVEVLGASDWLALEGPSGASGVASMALPIPPYPGLAGAEFFAQSVWMEPATAPCDPSPFWLTSSKGIAFTVQP